MSVRRRCENSKKLLPWFLFQQARNFSTITGLITGYRLVDLRDARSLRQSCSPVRDQRERVRARRFEITDENEFRAIAADIETAFNRRKTWVIESHRCNPRLGHPLLERDRRYVDLLVTYEE